MDRVGRFSTVSMIMGWAVQRVRALSTGGQRTTRHEHRDVLAEIGLSMSVFKNSGSLNADMFFIRTSKAGD